MMASNPNLQSLLPLRAPTFYILLSLAAGEKHGYAIIKTVENLSAGKLKMSTGTLYEALVRLLEQGLIERVGEPDADTTPADKERDQRSKTRKAYRLTSIGLQLLNAEVDRMQNLLAIAKLELGSQRST